MFEWLGEYTTQFNELWANLSGRARIVIISGIVLAVLLLGYLMIWNGSEQYEPLFSQLNPTDADAIVKKLEDEGIQYRLEDNGSTVLVPAGVVYKTRLDMAGAGLPSQGQVGFEIFDQSNFGTTDFERKVNYYRALGGELSRSVQAISGVEFARVQITAPKDSLFIDEEEPPQASVLLKLFSGFRMNRNQVRAISNLVASSVPDLNAAQVTIVDTNGNLLAGEAAGEGYLGGQTVANRLEIERQFAGGLEDDLRALLTRVVGPDNFSVQVRVNLNLDQREVESKEYLPVNGDEGIIRSQEEKKETYNGVKAAGGVPGTESNIPQYQAADGADSSGSYQNTNLVTNYEINEKIERHVYAPGTIDRLSVAVTINDSLDTAARQKIEEAVKAAIGYDLDRGDNVTVTSLAFDDSLENALTEAAAVTAAAQKRKTYIYAGLIILVIIILMVLFFTLRRSARFAAGPGGTVEKEVIPGRAVDYTVGDEEEQRLPEPELSPEEKERRQLKDQVVNLVSDKPEEAAQILKSWLTED